MRVFTCLCGKEFVRYGEKAKRAKYCSKRCQYENATRPSGLTYKIKVKNRAWFAKGHFPARPFPKGFLPSNFKGDDVGYDALHDWVKRHYGVAVKCEHCGKTEGKFHWANRSWKYKRDIDDWMQLCPKCHRKYDRSGGWGLATAKFPEVRRER